MFDVFQFIFKNLDWPAYILMLVGTFFIARMKSWGWLMCLTGSVFAILWGIELEKYGIVWGNVVFSLIYINAYIAFIKLEKAIAERLGEKK